MNISISSCRPQDSDAIVALGASTNTFPISQSQLESELHQKLSTVYVLEVDGQFAGYIDFWTIEDEIHIMGLSVTRPFQRQGMARRLLEHILKNHPHVKSLYLEVRARNHGAIGFYKAFGFLEQGIRKNYYPDGDDAVNLVYYVLPR